MCSTGPFCFGPYKAEIKVVDWNKLLSNLMDLGEKTTRSFSSC